LRVSQRTARALAASLAAAAFATGCATPVGISTASPRVVHRYLTQSALSADEPSTFSLIELRRYDLLLSFEDEPDAALLEKRQPRRREDVGLTEASLAVRELEQEIDVCVGDHTATIDGRGLTAVRSPR